jgi:hypothetical protein
MQTRWLWLVCLAGCGSGSSAQEKQVCEHAASLCDDDDEDAKSCSSEMSDAKKVMGDRYGQFLTCAAEATSCGEYAGCAIGGLGGGALDQLDDLGKGMKKMLDDELGDSHALDHLKDRVKSEVRYGIAELGGDDALPRACTRIETVCSKDQPFIRRKCRTLVENLGVDKPRIAELSSCIDATNNCFALEKCVEDLDAKMRGF